MTDEDRFEQFIELCKRVFERMQRDGTWPWPDDAPGGTREDGSGGDGDITKT